MANINVARVIGAGLVAGVVYNLGEAVLNMALIAADNTAMAKRCDLPPIGGDLIAKSGVLMFALGIVTVFVYAAIRPRFGAGARTALIAGGIVWGLAFLSLGLWFNWLGLMPIRPTAVAVTWELVETLLAALAGAWLYKES
jgi:hypothetical protein